jgi:hypothetical protein
MMLANMTLHSPDGALLVAMERFEELTSAVDCHGDDGQLSMTFKSREAFDFALKSWKYINDDENANFILITNHDGCGPQHERQTYRSVSSRILLFSCQSLFSRTNVSLYEIESAKLTPKKKISALL